MLTSQERRIVITKENQLEPRFLEELGNIYVESFPPSERIDFTTLVEGISDGKRWLFAAKTDDILTGFAITNSLLSADCHLLEYMAVKKEFRNQAIGSLLLRTVADVLHSQANVAGLIIEVEADNVVDPHERDLRRRRIQFYERNGARLVECAPRYYTPNLVADGILEMKLMWLPLREKEIQLSGVRLRACVRAIFIESYGRLQDDPLLETNLRSLIC